MFARLNNALWRSTRVRAPIRGLDTVPRRVAFASPAAAASQFDPNVMKALRVCEAMISMHEESKDRALSWRTVCRGLSLGGAITCAAKLTGFMAQVPPEVYCIPSGLAVVCGMSAFHCTNLIRNHLQFRDDWVDARIQIRHGGAPAMSFYSDLYQRDWYTRRRYPSSWGNFIGTD